MFKKPIDKFEDLSEEEIEDRIEDLRKQEFSKEDENAMIFAALKTLLPAVLAVCVLFALLVLLISLWLG